VFFREINMQRLVPIDEVGPESALLLSKMTSLQSSPIKVVTALVPAIGKTPDSVPQ